MLQQILQQIVDFLSVDNNLLKVIVSIILLIIVKWTLKLTFLNIIFSIPPIKQLAQSLYRKIKD